MIELAAALYVASAVIPALVVAGFIVWLGCIALLCGAVTLADRVRMPRIALGSWRGMPGFAVRLVALFCVVACIAALA